MIINAKKRKVRNRIITRVTPIFEDDPEIITMTDQEILNIALKMAGSWADREDMDENWLWRLRAGWVNRLDKLDNGQDIEK